MGAEEPGYEAVEARSEAVSVRRSLAELDALELLVIVLRYGFDEPEDASTGSVAARSIPTVARELGLAYDTVHDAERRAFHRLQNASGWDRHAPHMKARGCSVDGCEEPHAAHGLCGRHYRLARLQAIRGGQIPARRCSVGGCVEGIHAHGLCSRHYKQRRRNTQRKVRA